MLIAGAELEDGGIADIRIARGVVAAIGAMRPEPGEEVLHAAGGLLLPGLHDHHIHLAALAAALESVRCGPPDVTNSDELAVRLGVPGDGWLRGTGYHECVAGLLDAKTLDGMVPHRPVRVQHRSGRMWFFNSAGLESLLATGRPPAGLERDNNGYTGRLFDSDAWLRRRLGGVPPSLARLGPIFARRGICGVTDLSPGNDAASADHIAGEQARGALPQRVLLGGTLGLHTAGMGACLALGPAKLHLHDAELPPFDDAVAFVHTAHAQARAVAVHCVTEGELVFALAAIESAGALPGDRIEHAAVAPDSAVADIARLGLAVVSQPHFIAERGDAYRRSVAPALHPLLYRLRGFLDEGVTLAAGSDAPFGGTDPWASMAAAVSRRTAAGATLGAAEALSPEAALDLYLRQPDRLDARRRVTAGEVADLCLLDRPWARAREDLAAVNVRATLIGGRIVFSARSDLDRQGRIARAGS